ncbi:MAG: hypothetical protein CMD18_00935 [Flavobacteriales bacterium]|nr:hypothetical protein [Flavobacteriales bacterium]
MNQFDRLNNTYLVREDFISPLLGIIYLLVFFVLVFITYNFRSYTKTILFSNFSVRNLQHKDGSESNKNRKAGFWLTIFFLLVMSLLIHNLISSGVLFFNAMTQIEMLLISFGMVILFFAFKYLCKILLGKIFKKESLTILSLNRLAVKDKALGLLLFPLLLLYTFCLPLKETSIMLIFLFSSLYLVLKWINGFLIGIKHGNIPCFYSFLYICILEIIPFALILRLVSKSTLSI